MVEEIVRNNPGEDQEVEAEESDEESEGDAAGEEANGDQVGSSITGSPRGNAQGKNWHSYETLMKETYPAKSKIVYLKAYSEFERYLKKEKEFKPNVLPSELSFLNYFYYLKHDKKWGATTIWSHYSRLNAVTKRKFGFSLNTLTSISDLLKSYSAGYRVKKSSVFTPQQASS